MGTTFFLAAAVVAATTSTLLFAKSPKNSTRSEMAPANLEAFRLTTAEEGTVIPRVFGTVRLAGNLLHYGGLTAVPEYEETSGGKGGSSKKQSYLQGYHYYLDVWQGIGMGALELVRVYQDDRVLDTIPCAVQAWNSGHLHEEGFYPQQAGAFASRLPGVAHVWLGQWYLGLNSTVLPTLHFVVRFTGTVPVPDAMLDNGVNPAAIVWQLLKDAGASDAMLDMPSFAAAAQFWKQRGYGLNVALSRQRPVREHIQQILEYVGGWLIERADGTVSLRAPDPDAKPVYALHEGDFLEGSFVFKRAAWDNTWNDFSGKFIDAEQDYTERAVTANNSASMQLLGLRRKKSLDLTGFTDRQAAQRRLEEIRDAESYPAASFSFDLPRDYADIEQGHVLTLSHARFGIDQVRVRVLEVVRGGLHENRIAVQAKQLVEHTGGAFVSIEGVPHWTAPAHQPVPLKHTRLVELGRNPLTGTEPALLVLAARETRTEEGLLVARAASPDGTDYLSEALLRQPWAQYGTLVEDYPAETLALDDTQGLLYEPYHEDPVFAPVSRAELFAARRLALIDNEFVLFQSVVLEGTAGVRLQGIVRGYMNSPIENHRAGSAIWLFPLPHQGGNVIALANTGTQTFTLRPLVGDRALEADLARPITVTITGKARQPWAVAGLRAVRNGSAVQVAWSPVDSGHGGAGCRTENDPEPLPTAHTGDFLYSLDDGHGQASTVPSCTFTHAGAVRVQVKARQQGYESLPTTLVIGSADGNYYA